MIFSTKYSYIVLRLGIAAVFFWFGIDKFFHPSYWINAWVPAWVASLASGTGVSLTQFVYINGIFEVLVGLSLVTGVFMKIFSILGLALLLIISISIGVTEITIRDVGLTGALLAIFLWPEAAR